MCRMLEYEYILTQEIKQFVGMARRLWLRRNDVIHGGHFVHPNVLVQQTNTAIEDFSRANKLDSHGTDEGDRQDPIQWQRPPLGWFKANWDASVSKQQGRMGLGVVIRDGQGKYIAAQSKTEPGCLDPSAAEARAALLAIRLCVGLGLQQVQLEGDALMVVTGVNSSTVDWSSLGLLIDDIKGELRLVPGWQMKYIGREGNQNAHKLSRMATSRVLDEKWIDQPPECIKDCLAMELHASSA